MPLTIQPARRWNRPPEEVRRIIGPAAANWPESRLYAADQLAQWIAKQALKRELEKRIGGTCQPGQN